MKNEKYQKNLTTTIKLFTFFVVYKKAHIFLENIVWENVVYTIIFLVIFFNVT